MCQILMLFFLLISTTFAESWHQISGKYAKVEYTTSLESIADSLLKIADRSIPNLCAMHGFSIKSFENKPAKIILTDAPDVTNGFAVGNSVIIYALSSSYLPSWTGTSTWYSQVLTHELAHHVTIRKLSRKLDFIGEITSISTPRWFYEGIAQYFSESWNFYRGDLYVKNAILYGNLSYRSLFNMEDGQLLYGSAHAFIRYLASEYGDSSLIKLMSYNQEGWIFDFNNAFLHAYKKSPKQLFPEFIRHLVLYYGDKMIEYPINKNLSHVPVPGERIFQIIPLNIPDSTFLALSQLHKNHSFLTLIKYQIKNNLLINSKYITNNISTSFVLSPDQRFVAYGRPNLTVKNNINALDFQWQIYDLQESKEYLIDKSRRSRFATFTPENQLLFVEVNADKSVLTLYNPGDKTESELFQTKMPIGRIVVNNNFDVVFEAQQTNGNRDLFLLKDQNLTALTNDAIDDRNAFFLSESLLVFNRYEEQQPNLTKMRITDKKVETIFIDQYEYWLKGTYKSDSLIISGITPDRKSKFYLANIDSLAPSVSQKYIDTTSNGYDTWINKKPSQDLFANHNEQENEFTKMSLKYPQLSLTHLMSFALPIYDKELGTGIYGISSWFEPLQRQSLAGTMVVFPENLEKSLFAISHTIKFSNLDFFSSYYHGPIIFSFDEKIYQEILRDFASFGISAKRYINGNRRTPYRLSLFYLADHLYEEGDRGARLYHGPEISFRSSYQLPSLYSPAVMKREITFSGGVFTSIASDYDFSVYRAFVSAGNQLFLEQLGFQTSISYITASGELPSLQPIGIDRFYQYNIPRDIRFTKTIRGIGENVYGKSLIWNSSELNFFVAEKTPLTLFILPINNLAMSVFLDAAQVSNVFLSDKNTIFAYGTGFELSFGNPIIRFSAGHCKR